MDTRTLLRERLRRSRDWTQTIDELEKELEGSGTQARAVRTPVRARRSRRGCDSRARARSRLVSTRVEAPPGQPQGALARARGVRRDRSLRDGRQARRDGAAQPARRSEPRRRSSARRCSTAGRRTRRCRSSSARSSAQPDSVRVKDALAARHVRPRVLDRRGRSALRRRRAVRRRARRAHAAARRAHPADRERRRIRGSRSCSSGSSRRTSTSRSANFIYETVLADAAIAGTSSRSINIRRAERASDHGEKVEALRTFALEWVQRFKDRDRGAKFFDAALQRDREQRRSADALGGRGVLAAPPGPGRQGRVAASCSTSPTR